jgi:hypothetical protein
MKQKKESMGTKGFVVDWVLKAGLNLDKIPLLH